MMIATQTSLRATSRAESTTTASVRQESFDKEDVT